MVYALLVSVSNEGFGESAHVRRLVRAYDGRIHRLSM